ncbi:hypothetical protein Q5W_03095 [Hydrogenophaga sp. PBC]|nr:hypothetical protein Q5W_03095 [Hydrogenophaga sp. PBC]
MCGAIYAATFYAFKSRQTDDLSQKEHLIAYLASEALKRGDEAKLKHELKDFMVGHPEFGLSVRGAEGAVFFEDLLPVSNAPRREMQFDLVSPVAGKSPLRAELSLDIARDVNLLRRIAAALVLAAAGGVLLISLGGFLLVWLIDVSATKYANITYGETVVFQGVGGQKFAWTFNGLDGRSWDLAKFAPAGLAGKDYRVYVTKNPLTRR